MISLQGGLHIGLTIDDVCLINVRRATEVGSVCAYSVSVGFGANDAKVSVYKKPFQEVSIVQVLVSSFLGPLISSRAPSISKDVSRSSFTYLLTTRLFPGHV